MMASQLKDKNVANSVSLQQWLESLMLQQYESHFIAAGLDVLGKCARLTDGDLVRIGIGPGGHRKRILAHLPVVNENNSLAPNTFHVPSSVYSTAKNIDDDDEDNKDVYDIPPLAAKLSISSSKPESLYMNIVELNTVLVPVLPPKKRCSTVEEIDKSLGIFTPIVSPGVTDAKMASNDILSSALQSSSQSPARQSQNGVLLSSHNDSVQVKNDLADVGLKQQKSVDKPIPKPRIRKPIDSSLTPVSSGSLDDLLPTKTEGLTEQISYSSEDLSSVRKTEPVAKKLNAGLELELEMFVTSVKKSLLKSEGSESTKANGSDKTNSADNVQQPQQLSGLSENSLSNSSTQITDSELHPQLSRHPQCDGCSEQANSISKTNKSSEELSYELCEDWNSALTTPMDITIENNNFYCEIPVNSSDREGNNYDCLTSVMGGLVSPVVPVSEAQVTYDNVVSKDHMCPALSVAPPVPRRRDNVPVSYERSSIAEFAKFAEERCDVAKPAKPNSGSNSLSPIAAGFAEAFDSYFNQPDLASEAWSPDIFKTKNDISPAQPDLEYFIQPMKQPVTSRIQDSPVAQCEEEDADDSLYETPVSFTRGSALNSVITGSSSKCRSDQTAEVYQTDEENTKGNEKIPVRYVATKLPAKTQKSKVFVPTSGEDVTEEIRYTGYLSKANIGLRTVVKPEMVRRWCVLDKGTLSCYDSDKCIIVKEAFDDQEMLSISVCNDARFTNAFELRCLRHLGSSPTLRSSVFVAEALGDSVMWISVIAMSMASRIYCSALQQIVDFQYGGIVYARWVASSASSDWHRTWMHLQHKVLFIYSQKKEFETYDLRKAKDIRLVQQLADFGASAAGQTSSIVIDLPAGRTVWLQNEVQQEIEYIFTVLRTAMLEAGNSLSSQPLTVDNIPIIVDKLINFVGVHGIEVEGVYRLSGQNSKVAQLLKCCQDDVRGMVIKLEEYQIHDVTNALKRFFRTLEEPLLTDKLYTRWIEAARLTDVNTKLQAYKECIGDLPAINHATLKYLVMHLMRVAKKESCNKMSATNIASIFGPCMLKLDNDSQPPTDFGSTNVEISIFKDFLDYHQLLFQIDDKDFERENKIEDAVKRIEQLNTDRSQSTMIPQGDMLLGIHINSKEGNVISHKVPVTMTASELVTSVLEKLANKDNSRRRWAIFEMISNSDLERPLHSSDNVINTTLKWGTWPMELCRDNFLCLKHSSVYDGLELVFNANDSMYAELHYASLGKKAFRRYYFEFSNNTIGFRRDARAGISQSWNVHDLIVYLGVQQQRNPPTRFGFSFYARTEVLVGNFLGHSICCENEQELYQWLAAIFRTQYPDGLDGKPAHSPRQSVAHVQLPNNRPSDEASSSPSTDVSNRVKQFTSILQKKFKR